MAGLLGRAIGSVVAPVVEVIDIDGVVQRINLEDALSRVDLDALLSRVDLNALLERVDVNHHLERVDFNAHLERVDLDRIVERSNIGAIVARSSSGVFDVVLDGARSQIVKADVAFQRLGRCAYCRKQPWELPPRVVSPMPNANGASNRDFPERSLSLALHAQRRYAGILPRFISGIIDGFIITIVFTIFLLLVETIINRFQSSETPVQMSNEEEWVFYPLAFWLWKVFYTSTSLAAAGRTIGSAICGLLVVKNNTGERIAPLQALIRTILEPFSVIIIVGALMGWVRKDGRQLHDILTRTGVCYSWDARLAYLREQGMGDKQDV